MIEDADCAVVRRHQEAIERGDLEGIAATLAPNIIQHYQRPTGRRDDGGLMSDVRVGREAIMEEIRENLNVTLYKAGTVKVDIERMISNGAGWVAAQFSLSAICIATNAPYHNYYFFLYHIVDGQIAEYWQYLDTAYAQKTLFSKHAAA